MGWRSQPTRQVQLDACKVPAGNLLGEEGHGFRYAMAGLDGGRLNIAACSLGAAQAALEKTLAYMGERKAFGQSIDQFQALQFRLADMEIELQAARIFLHQAAWKLDTGAPDATKACAMAKKLVTRRGAGWPTSACSFMAATAIWPITGSRRWCATCACTRSSKAPTRSCG
jgi:alkylation response protein AidB-like acyl-CoA dehydrogenase